MDVLGRSVVSGKWSWFATSAECKAPGCGWRANARNAQGLAARHAKAHAHRVEVFISSRVMYGEDGQAVDARQLEIFEEGSAE